MEAKQKKWDVLKTSFIETDTAVEQLAEEVKLLRAKAKQTRKTPEDDTSVGFPSAYMEKIIKTIE